MYPHQYSGCYGPQLQQCQHLDLKNLRKKEIDPLPAAIGGPARPTPPLRFFFAFPVKFPSATELHLEGVSFIPHLNPPLQSENIFFFSCETEP